MMALPFRKTVLDNGLRIIQVRQPESLATTVFVLVAAGSEYEVESRNGVSHFLEHLCFKGTEKRPTSRDITVELDALGAEYNAFTSTEVTGYYAKAANEHFPVLLDVVSDIYLNSTLDPAELEKERGVIIEEISMKEDVPMDKVGEVFEELLYGNQPAGWSVIGKRENVERLTREEIEAYRSAHYVAGKTVVVVSGGYEGEVVGMVSDAFKSIGALPVEVKARTVEEQREPQLVLVKKETDQAHLIIGLRTFDVFDSRRYALTVLNGVLGGSMSSRLFHRIREVMGAAYYVASSADFSSDHGYLAVSLGVEKRRVGEVVRAVLEEFARLRDERISDEELERAKEGLAGRMVLRLETSDELASFFGGDEVTTGDARAPEEILQKLRAVTADEVLSVAREIVKNEGLNLACIGNLDSEDELRHLLRLG